MILVVDVEVLSESESFFGTHPIYDLTTLFSFFGVILGVVELIWGISIPEGDEEDEMSTKRLGETLIKLASASLTATETGDPLEVLAELVDGDTIGDWVGLALEQVNLGWAYDLVCLNSDFEKLKQSIIEEPNLSRNVRYLANDIAYELLIELNNGEIHKVKDIYEAISCL